MRRWIQNEIEELWRAVVIDNLKEGADIWLSISEPRG